MTDNERNFFTAFVEDFNQCPLTFEQYFDFVQGADESVPSETLSTIYDARNLWISCTEEMVNTLYQRGWTDAADDMKNYLKGD